MIIIFLGIPGSGKGTQAKKISQKMGIPYVGTGEILRENVEKRSPLGIKVKGILDAGRLVDDATMLSLVEQAVKDKDSFILDGMPRTVPQAEGIRGIFSKYGKKLDCVLFLDVVDEEVIKRMLLRGRGDDTEETIKERLSEYRKKTAPLREYYEKTGLLKNIDGTGNVSEILARIENALNDKN
ncbi:MAG: adenylate kinase [bacterium]